MSPAPCASDIDLLLTAPSPEPAGLLASRLALAGESGELLLLFGVAGGDFTLGVAGATYAIMASLSRHFTPSACQSKSHVHVYTTVYLLSVVESALALAGESGELLLLFGVAGGDFTLGVAGATYAIMASLSRHFTPSACQSKSHVHVYTTVYLLSVVESEMFDFKFFSCIVKK